MCGQRRFDLALLCLQTSLWQWLYAMASKERGSLSLLLYILPFLLLFLFHLFSTSFFVIIFVLLSGYHSPIPPYDSFSTSATLSVFIFSYSSPSEM
jgi:hypothetical protein